MRRSRLCYVAGLLCLVACPKDDDFASDTGAQSAEAEGSGPSTASETSAGGVTGTSEVGSESSTSVASSGTEADSSSSGGGEANPFEICAEALDQAACEAIDFDEIEGLGPWYNRAHCRWQTIRAVGGEEACPPDGRESQRCVFFHGILTGCVGWTCGDGPLFYRDTGSTFETTFIGSDCDEQPHAEPPEADWIGCDEGCLHPACTCTCDQLGLAYPEPVPCP